MLGPLILADAEMLGVDAFNDSAVVVKFFIKTRPLQQWTVKREMLRRIKKRFDELGIEIPFPQRTVYHRLENGEGPGIDTGSLREDAAFRPAQRG
jgi:small-conductance mechanosensitive channel